MGGQYLNDVKKIGFWVWIWQVAGSCECGDEPSGSIKGREFLEQLTEIQSFQGLCSMELVIIKLFSCYYY